MATNTTNYNLNKPEDSDNADLKVFVGDNMDIIDAELVKKVEKDGTTGLIKPVDLPSADGVNKGVVIIGDGLRMVNGYITIRLGEGLELDATALNALKLKIGTGLQFNATTGELEATGGGSGGTATTANSFLAYQTTAQNFSAGAWTKIQFQGMKTHIGGGFDLATYDYVVPETGTYLIGGAVSWQSQLDGNRTVLAYYKNGYSDGWIADISAGKAGQGMAGGDTIVSLNAGDRLSLYAYTAGAVYTPIVSGNALTYFFGIKL
jgi:hypothetical protein